MRSLVAAVLVWCGLSLSLAEASPLLYEEVIKPHFRERCYACHGALKQKAGLRVDTAAFLLQGGEEAVVVPGRPSESVLLQRLSHPDEEERMPPEGRALDEEILDAVESWILQGAMAPEEEAPEEDPTDHWAFRRIERPTLELSEGAHPIDALLEHSQQALGLVSQGEAPREVLLRRLYLDVIGLLPNVRQMEDERPWEVVVEELLHLPQHGERWGRHWMDVWRYSDWYGLGAQLRYSQKHLWHWRDWIIESLNADKGYDQMILEMLAGDEWAPDDPEVVRATGFLARNYYLFNRTTWLDSTIEHTGKAFLGLTLNCAKCHDHKYDPVSQADYYRFRAIFEPHHVRLDPVPGETDLERNGLPRVYDDHPDAVTYLHRRGDARDPDTSAPIPPGVPEIFAHFAPEVQPVALSYPAHTPGAREYVHRDRLKLAESQLQTARKQLEEAKLAQGEAAPSEDEPVGDEWIIDDFDGPNASMWDVPGEGWDYREGQLHKTRADRLNEVVLLRAIPPRDFEMVCRYTHVGGAEFKSIGFRFDRSEDGRFQHQVYTSAHAPDPKIQVAHTVEGKNHYPRAGYASRPIQVGGTYTLRLAVRGTRLNAWLDGERVLAYDLPQRAPEGRLALSAFDALASFDHFALRALPEEVELAAPSTESASIAPLSLEVAQAQVAWREAELEALQAVVAADRARAGMVTEEEALASLQNEALRKQRRREVADAEWAVAKAGKDAKALKAARQRLEQAQQRWAAWGQKGAGTVDNEDYVPIRASRKALETPEHKFADYPMTYPDRSSGRRLALAKWMVDRENPLTARVAVNHVWARHFGRPLVSSMFDFGRRAAPPVQHALLDYLAVELIESDWSLRHLHRLMLTSAAYRRSSSELGVDAPTKSQDADNAYYWRMPTRRMEAELVRDNLLHLAGELNLSRGGPSVDPKSGGRRRSLYFLHSRDQKDLFMEMFDGADHLRCYRRKESIVPQQALALSNSRLALEMAQKIAQRVHSGRGGGESFVASAFHRLLGRWPDPLEHQACVDFMAALEEVLPEMAPEDAAKRVRSRLVHALLNHNDFVTIR